MNSNRRCKHCGLELKQLSFGDWAAVKGQEPEDRQEWYGMCPGPDITRWPRFIDWARDPEQSDIGKYLHEPEDALVGLVREFVV